MLLAITSNLYILLYLKIGFIINIHIIDIYKILHEEDARMFLPKRITIQIE